MLSCSLPLVHHLECDFEGGTCGGGRIVGGQIVKGRFVGGQLVKDRLMRR